MEIETYSTREPLQRTIVLTITKVEEVGSE